MRIFIAGADGFIGRHLAAALARRGHDVVAGVRRPRGGAARREIAFDFAVDHDPEIWRPRLAGIDVAINAVGILRESRRARFDDVHTRGPIALFQACARGGVRVVQISALGAEADAPSRYHASKHAADAALLALAADAIVVQPGLVFGPGGASATFFTHLAVLPLIPYPDTRGARIQPIHVDDLVAGIVRVVERPLAAPARRLRLVGPRALDWREFLGALRRALGLGRARLATLPLPLMRVVATVAKRVPRSLLDRETLALLGRDNVAPVTGTRRLLGRAPRAPEAFIDPDDAPRERRLARLDWLLLLLRLALAAMWLGTAWVSLFVFPRSDSDTLLAALGLTGDAARLALYGGAGLDAIFGMLALPGFGGRRTWLAQIALVLAYTALITWRLPAFWVHPFAPVLKNVPILAALFLLAVLDED